MTKKGPEHNPAPCKAASTAESTARLLEFKLALERENDPEPSYRDPIREHFAWADREEAR